MTRKEEATNKILELIDIVKDVPKNESILAIGLDMVEWADKTMIEKACEWLKENMGNYIIEHPFFPSGSSVTVEEDKMVEDFRKTMEGE